MPSSADQPWSVLQVSQALPSASSLGNTVVAPSGAVYQSWSNLPPIPVTRQYGDISQTGTQSGAFLTSAGPDGATGFVVEIGGATYVDALALDASGNIYLAGIAGASGLPVTAGAYQSTASGTNPGFLCELQPDGSLVFCTYLNGLGVGIMTLDSAGNIYLVGSSISPLTTTPGALSQGNTIVAKLAPGGSKLVFQAALITGFLSAVSVDSSGNIYIAGGGDVAGGGGTTGSAPVFGSGIWVVKADGSALLYSNFVMNSGEKPAAMALDANANVYWTGNEADGSLFVRKYVGYGPSVAFEYTALGQQTPGSSVVTPVAIAVDNTGAASVTGYTTALNFPTYQSTHACNSVISVPAQSLNVEDGFLMRFSPTGSLLQSTYLSEGGQPLALFANSTSAYIPVATFNGDVVVMTLGAQADITSGLPFACIGNAASLALGPLAPGEVVSLFGSGIGPQQAASYQLDANQQIATTLAETQVTFNGIPAPLLYVQDQQINAIVPWEEAIQTRAEVCVSYGSSQSNCIPAAIVEGSPGVFQTSPGVAAAVNQDGTVNSPSNPAPLGSIVSIYATGTGAILPTPSDGAITQLPLPKLTTPVQVLCSDPDDPLTGPMETYSGPAPLEPAGVTQINFMTFAFPGFCNSTNAFFLYMVLPDGTTASSPGFTISVK